MTNENEEECYCGDYEGNKKGTVFVECCGVCNRLWPIGICQVCEGTGFVKCPDKTNYEMIKQALEGTGGYLCGHHG